VWWCTSEIPALGKLKQKDPEFKDSLGYMERPKTLPQNKEHIWGYNSMYRMWLAWFNL
jgi:hypothetical protein